MMPQRNQEKDIVTAASIWFEISGVVDPGKKKFDFYRQIFEKFQFKFFRQFYKRMSSFAGKFPKILIVFRQLKKFDFPSKKLSIYSYLWANYSISSQN